MSAKSRQTFSLPAKPGHRRISISGERSHGKLPVGRACGVRDVVCNVAGFSESGASALASKGIRRVGIDSLLLSIGFPNRSPLRACDTGFGESGDNHKVRLALDVTYAAGDRENIWASAG